MKEECEIRLGEMKDIEHILDIYESARSFMRANNNFNQWKNGYPGKEDVLRDIEDGNCYVGTDRNGVLVMTFAFILGEDPTYKNIINGKWLNEEPYGTIHRIASNGMISGVLDKATEYCFHKIDNIRIDTHEDNMPMLNSLKKLNYEKCGIIFCRDGSPRIAFQKQKNKKMDHKFELLKELLKEDRSYRQFDENFKINPDLLKNLIELTRYCSSGRNLQPLKYYIATDKEQCERIFPLLKWAGYLTDWDGPEEGKRPVAFLIQCLDTDLTNNCLCDDGIQLQAITLGATALGLGCCIIKAFNAVKIKEILELPHNYEPLYVIAIGKPLERILIEDLKGFSEENIKYYRTPDGVHHVPKRLLEDLIINK